jgi:hypothetical protein
MAVMTHSAPASILGSEFDEFLFAPIGKDRNELLLSVLSALARMDVDPWQEASELARLPREAAIQRRSDLPAAKRDIVQNAIDLAHVMGIKSPRIAILAAVEMVNPKLRSTIDAAALCKMADRGEISGGLLDGPLAFDNAVSPAAAREKVSFRPSPARPTSSLCPISRQAICRRSSLPSLAGPMTPA